MTKKSYTFILLILITAIVVTVGCSSDKGNNDKIAYITSKADSEYANTFKDLQLGILFDFDLKLLNADKSWVDIWVEGYRDGKAVEPFHLTQLSYGHSPVQVEEGQMGFGIINPNSNEPLFFLYSEGIKVGPHRIEYDFFVESALSSWSYAIGSETIGLESGEELILAVYRQGEESLRAGYEYQDIDAVNTMINESKTVLLLKIKIEHK
ncbi:MAG: hypothetical protein K0S61_3120 [Anaerocolumna sp.]|jgi:hypothetical protein|nr:hypothetical protein [Anaerocolumna sp.]